MLISEIIAKLPDARAWYRDNGVTPFNMLASEPHSMVARCGAIPRNCEFKIISFRVARTVFNTYEWELII